MTQDLFRGRALIYADPRVLSLESSWSPAEPHEPSWEVRIHWQSEPEDNYRIVTGRLHASSEDGYVFVTVGALMAESGTATSEEYRDDFLGLARESEALDTLYTHARQQALTLAMATGFTLELPLSFYPPTSILDVERTPDDEADDHDESQTVIG